MGQRRNILEIKSNWLSPILATLTPVIDSAPRIHVYFYKALSIGSFHYPFKQILRNCCSVEEETIRWAHSLTVMQQVQTEPEFRTLIPALSNYLPRRICSYSNPMGMNSTAPTLAYLSSWGRGCDYLESVQVTVSASTSSLHREGKWHPGNGDGASGTPPSGEKTSGFPSLSRVTLGNRGLDFKTLACAVASCLPSIYYAPSLSRSLWTRSLWTGGWRYSPLWTHCFKGFPGVAQKCSSGIRRFGSKSTEVRTQPFPAVCELVIFFLMLVRSITLLQFRSRAFQDSQVTALINYCISCFTYPNYLPVAQTMAFLKFFIFTCSFW